MGETLASFRDLKGIGPATEARLHDAGLGTWEALSQVLAALVQIRARNGETVAVLADLVAARAAEENSGMPDVPTTGTDVPTGSEPTKGPEAVGAAASREHQVVLDAGTTIGGTVRAVELVVSAAGLAGHGGVAYEARLACRALGAGQAGGSGWTNLVTRRGLGLPPEPLPLTFEAVPVPAGIQRLRLELSLRLPVARRQLPPITLVG